MQLWLSVPIFDSNLKCHILVNISHLCITYSTVYVVMYIVQCNNVVYHIPHYCHKSCSRDLLVFIAAVAQKHEWVQSNHIARGNLQWDALTLRAFVSVFNYKIKQLKHLTVTCHLLRDCLETFKPAALASITLNQHIAPMTAVLAVQSWSKWKR